MWKTLKLVGRQTYIEILEKKNPTNSKTNSADPYPWLDPVGPTKHMSDAEIIKKYVDLSASCMSNKEKENEYQTLIKHKKHFITPFFEYGFPYKRIKQTICRKGNEKRLIIRTVERL